MLAYLNSLVDLWSQAFDNPEIAGPPLLQIFDLFRFVLHFLDFEVNCPLHFNLHLLLFDLFLALHRLNLLLEHFDFLDINFLLIVLLTLFGALIGLELHAFHHLFLEKKIRVKIVELLLYFEIFDLLFLLHLDEIFFKVVLNLFLFLGVLHIDFLNLCLGFFGFNFLGLNNSLRESS